MFLCSLVNLMFFVRQVRKRQNLSVNVRSVYFSVSLKFGGNNGFVITNLSVIVWNSIDYCAWFKRPRTVYDYRLGTNLMPSILINSNTDNLIYLNSIIYIYYHGIKWTSKYYCLFSRGVFWTVEKATQKYTME